MRKRSTTLLDVRTLKRDIEYPKVWSDLRASGLYMQIQVLELSCACRMCAKPAVKVFATGPPCCIEIKDHLPLSSYPRRIWANNS